jgi:DNA-binding NarL/FixJ family response regulator
MRLMRILLVDDHVLVRAGLRSLLEGFDGVEVVAEAGNGREAIELARTHAPHLVLMDIALPELNGLEAAARLRDEQPGARVIMLSMHSNEEYVLRALRAGVAGYLLKDSAPSELQHAIETVARGEVYLSPRASRKVIDDYLRRHDAGDDPLQQLTPRQREILQLIAEGKSTKDIGFLLAISIKTVETHRAQIMRRLGVHDVPGLVRCAMRLGLVPPPV